MNIGHENILLNTSIVEILENAARTVLNGAQLEEKLNLIDIISKACLSKLQVNTEIPVAAGLNCTSAVEQ